LLVIHLVKVTLVFECALSCRTNIVYHFSYGIVLQEYLAGVILPTSGIDLAICHWIYNNAQSIEDLFVYEACIRDLMGNSTTFGRIKILPKVRNDVKSDHLRQHWIRFDVSDPTNVKSNPPSLNTTWHYDNNLIATPREIKERMLNCSKAVEEERAVAMSKVRKLRKSWLTMEIWNVSSLEPYL
ncbi:hypothetical protein COOONC_14764, partial [Cooperia oncophora]